MYLSALLTSLPLEFDRAVREMTALGFTHVDVVGLVERPEQHLAALAESGLIVSCGAIGRGLPEGWTLDVPAVALRRKVVEEMQRQITDIARLGGRYGYLVPGKDGSKEALTRFAEACALLADFAGGCLVRLCLEHSPGTALSRADDTLAWLERIGHDNLGLLLDVGHCLLSGEDPATVVTCAKERLFYVHLDDNDGVGDLHWPLLTGRLTEEMLGAALAALAAKRYAGGLALEFRAENPEPAKALHQGRQLLDRLMKNV
jgi:sugar phosphate isomerase/epimerase